MYSGMGLRGFEQVPVNKESEQSGCGSTTFLLLAFVLVLHFFDFVHTVQPVVGILYMI